MNRKVRLYGYNSQSVYRRNIGIEYNCFDNQATHFLIIIIHRIIYCDPAKLWTVSRPMARLGRIPSRTPPNIGIGNLQGVLAPAPRTDNCGYPDEWTLLGVP